MLDDVYAHDACNPLLDAIYVCLYILISVVATLSLLYTLETADQHIYKSAEGIAFTVIPSTTLKGQPNKCGPGASGYTQTYIKYGQEVTSI